MSRSLALAAAFLGAASFAAQAAGPQARSATRSSTPAAATATQSAVPLAQGQTTTGQISAPAPSNLTTAPSRESAPAGAAVGSQTGTIPGLPDNASRDIVLSPTEASQQFRAQRAGALPAANTPGATNVTTAAPGNSVEMPGAGTATPGTVISGQVVRFVPGRSITVRDVSGLVRTFALPAGYVLPVDVGAGTVVVLTTQNGGFVSVANASGVFPASSVTGGAGESAPIVTQVAAANQNIYRPNFTSQPIQQSAPIQGIGGFYTPAPGAAAYSGTESPVGGTLSASGVTVETGPAGPYANAGLATSGYGGSTASLAGGSFSTGGPTGAVSGPVSSISYNATPLATMVARMEGNTGRLPNTALRGGALATITGTGRDLVTRTAVTTYRVVSWDGQWLVALDDQGTRHRWQVSDGARVPRNLQPGKLVVIDVRDDVVRGIRYLL